MVSTNFRQRSCEAVMKHQGWLYNTRKPLAQFQKTSGTCDPSGTPLRVLHQSASCWNSFATMFADVKNSSSFSCSITNKSAAGPRRTKSTLQQIEDQLPQRKSLKWAPSWVQNMISVMPGWYTHRRSQEEEINLELGLRAVYRELGQMSHVTSETCSGWINNDSFSILITGCPKM